MPLGLTMHGKWDGISMASATLHSFKHERPAYSTPQPVENTPSNNDCRMVELRGAKVASFILGGDDFICLPQAFDLFLKHLVGGLHTVYTKLKRLNISPVVCNVEQVRILRGLGAIQPGVNRCKLITRKDFEILYQDCTQASRPGRPPKRYPMLPPTTDLSTHYPAMRSMAHGLLGAPDISVLHKRMRLDQDAEKQIQQQQEGRLSDSPQRDNATVSTKDLINGTNNIPTNAANFYMQAQQALRQQYQQASSSGIHNGLDTQHAVAAAGMNPALAPLMMMSHPALFSGTFPSGMLNHISQFAQNHGNGNAVTNAAAAAAAQIAANGGNMQQQAVAAYQVAAAAQSAAQASLAVAASVTTKSSSPIVGDSVKIPSSLTNKETVEEERLTPKGLTFLSDTANENGNEAAESPRSSLSSLHEQENDKRLASPESESGDSVKLRIDANYTLERVPEEDFSRSGDQSQEENVSVKDKKENSEQRDRENPFLASTSLTGPGNISSMQTLLTNIQGLLKVAADNARLQEKHSSFEIADLKNKVAIERQLRGSAEKKLLESEKSIAIARRRLEKERKVRKILEEQLDNMKQNPGQGESVPDKIATAPSIPITGVLASGRDSSSQRSLSLSPRDHPSLRSPPRSEEAAMSPGSSIENGNQLSPVKCSAASPLSSSLAFLSTTPASCGSLSTVVTNTNSNNNANSSTYIFPNEGQSFPPVNENNRRASTDFNREINTVAEQGGVADHFPARHLFFNNGCYQATATQ